MTYVASSKTFLKSYAFEIAFVIIVLAVSAAVVAPFYYSRPLRSPDGNRVAKLIWTDDLPMHLPLMQEFDRVRRSGVIYPRWLAGANSGYGIVTMVFYPPGSYFLCSWMNSLTNDWLNTLFLVSALALAASGLSFYALSTTFFGKISSALASLFYMLAPFHVYNLYWQGAVPQFLGYAFLPLIVYFAYRLGKTNQLRFYAGLGLFYGLYILTHLPVSYLFSYVLALYALTWSVKERDWRIGLRITIGMALGLSLSAIYWLPAALESKYIYEWASELFPYNNSLLTLLPEPQEYISIINAVFVIYVLTIAVARVVLRATVLGVPTKHPEGNEQSHIRIWTLLGITAIFMTTSFSVYVSALIPRIQVAVPANRWLVIAALFMALLTAAAIEQLQIRRDLPRFKLWSFRGAVTAILIVSVGFSIKYAILEALERSSYEMPAAFINTGFTPKGSTAPENLPDTPLAVLEPAGGISEVIEWEPQHRRLAVRVDQPSELRLKTYNFPGWTGRIDGQKTPLSSDKDGVQIISVPPGTHKIETDFVNTPPRKIGTALFFVGLILIIGLASTDFARRLKTRSTAHREPRELTDQPIVKEASRRKIVLASLIVLILIIAALFVYRWHAPQEQSATGEKRGSDVNVPGAAGGSLDRDADARLSVGSLNSIPVAVDEASLNELMNALPIGKNDRVEELIQAGRLFRVPNNTRVRILEVRSAKVKVRVLEGESVTLDGWVPERWIK
jgi:hypothetical protein